MMNRRAALKGIGCTIALPMLEAMLPLNALAQSVKTPPMRMAFLFVPNGVDIQNWTPATSGALGELPQILRSLEGVKSHINILTGLTQHNANALGDGPGDHARSTATWLTGVHVKKTAGSDIQCGISADQVAAQEIGKLTRFASLEIGCERGAVAGDCDSGYSCAYSSNVSWRSANTPNAKEVNPRLLFERLFGAGGNETPEVRARRDQYRVSILDYVTEDATRLRGQLGLKDQQKLDEYLSGVREVERRLQVVEANNIRAALDGVVKPTGIPADFDEHIRLMGDMMVLAFQADLTRICTFMFANDGSNRSYAKAGVSEGHHDMSHHGKDAYKLAQKNKIDRFHAEQLAYILNKMQGIKEFDRTLLDNSLICYGAGISDGDRHNHDNLPILMAGKAGGTLKTGRHLVYEPGTPMNNLFVSMLDRVGVKVEKLGDSTGKLRELF
ncbi:MAG: DUF1552 domain-containing protein [Fimbriimonadaceae bacterium]